jgi:hypothetical protein
MTIMPIFACFAGSGSAELRMLLGAIGTFWIIAGVATLANIVLLGLYAARNRGVLFHILLFASYSTAAGALYSGWLFETAPLIAAWGILVIPLTAVIHFLTLFRRRKAACT